MSEMKMSDVFGLPLVVCRNNPQMITAKPTYKGKTDFYYATIRSPVELEVNYATYAVNNHDRMVEEIAELRKLVKLAFEEGADEGFHAGDCDFEMSNAFESLNSLTKPNQEGEG